MSEIFVSQNESDTLLYLGEFSINIKLFPLFNHKIIAQKIELKNIIGDFERLFAQLAADSTDNEKEQVQDSESDSWEFAVNRLLVESSYIEYRDEDIGFDLIMDIGTINLHLGTLNLDTLIFCKRIEISETKISYESLNIPEDDDTSVFEFADIYVEKAHLTNSEFAYIDTASAILFYAEGEQVNVSGLLVDITHEKVIINEGYAKNTTTSVIFLPKNDTTPETYDYLNWGQYLWRVEGNILDVIGYKLTVDYFEEPEPKGHFNNEHLNFYDVKGKLTNFILDYDFRNFKNERLLRGKVTCR